MYCKIACIVASVGESLRYQVAGLIGFGVSIRVICSYVLGTMFGVLAWSLKVMLYEFNDG